MAKQSQIIVRLSDDTKNKLNFIAWHDRQTMTDIITGLIDKTIAAHEKKIGAITDKELKEAGIIK